jgi:hypothetical protein
MELMTNDASDILSAKNITGGSLTAGAWNAPVAHLCQGMFSYDRKLPLTSLLGAEANYDGYAGANVTWDVPGIAIDGTVDVIGTTPTFQDTGSSTVNQIYGLFLTDAAHTTLLGCAAFDNAPLPMVNPTCRINVTFQLKPEFGGPVAVIA